jgi:predicted GTPase
MKSKSSKKYRVISASTFGGRKLVPKYKCSHNAHKVVDANRKQVMHDAHSISLIATSHKPIVVSSSEIDTHSRTMQKKTLCIKCTLSKIK